MSKTYQPLGNTVIIESIQPSSTIQLPGTYIPDTFTVIAIGDGTEIPNDLSVGDTVIINSGDNLIKIKDTNYSIINAESILVRINEE